MVQLTLQNSLAFDADQTMSENFPLDDSIGRAPQNFAQNATLALNSLLIRHEVALLQFDDK
jgi:hypothetical protein